MNFDSIGKNLKVNYIDLKIGNKIIPEGSFGTVVNYNCGYEFAFKVENDTICIRLSSEQIKALELGNILEFVSSNILPNNPKFLEGQLVKTNIGDYGFIIESNYDASESDYIYAIKDIESMFYENSVDTEYEKDLEIADNCEINIEKGEYKYQVNIKTK